ncbi:hypothetical protein PLESTM_001636200 [Pleodorina starrii]|nr:hypothetical protein PLESTM_001636200 [Pleodorina starrii]
MPPQHPGISGLSKTAWAMVLELAEPYTTKTLIVQSMSENRRVYTNLQAYDWLLQIASALSSLHGSHPRIIHRDVKNENVLLKEVPMAAAEVAAEAEAEAEEGRKGAAGSGGGCGGGCGGIWGSGRSRLVAKVADLGLHVVG